MTTAHRPTYNAAIASGNNPSGNLIVCQTTKIANRDAANFLTIKTRNAGQGAPDERGSRREFKDALELKEKKAKDERDGVTEEKTEEKVEKKKRPPAQKMVEENPFPEDADDDVPEGSNKSDSDDDDDDEDEDAEELMRELQKIKSEREAEEEVQKSQQQKADDRSRRDEVMKGNPLLGGGEDLSLKRKWDDDTVFKNQSRTAPKQKLRYINDSVRSDFHKKFLNKYIWVDGHAH